MIRTIILATSALALVAAAPERAEAQYYKGKTINMIVNYPAGGPTDVEGRIVAQHLPQHIPGNPTVVVRNVGGAGGLIGSNQLGEATPNGETIGFFTLAMNDQLLGNSAMKTRYSDFVLIAGVECPLVVYMRKDTPPGINVATDLMKAKDFKALSLNTQSSNTLNMALALQLLGVKYQPVPAYRGLKDVETAILQNIGQMANSSLSGWAGSVEPTMGHLVIPLWQLSPRTKGGSYPRSKALPNLQTFEEFYASVFPGKPLKGQIAYEALRALADPQLAMFRVAVTPPKTSPEAVAVLRSAFTQMWKSPQFLANYSRIIKTEPILVTGAEGQEVLAALGSVPEKYKEYLTATVGKMTN
jgi:tripartite-type tricarboxylate transporter receptor subunit TctC